MLLRTRILVPVTAPPIEDGAVLISQGLIQWMGPWADRPASDFPTVDLGDAILSPGWVNAHCHLEYSRLHDFCPGSNGAAAPDFVDWIRAIVAAKARQPDSFFADSWRDGEQQLIESGTTTVADIVSTPAAWDASQRQPVVTVHPYWEMTGVLRGSDPGALVAEAMRRVSTGGGLSPHALYSTTPALLGALAAEIGRRSVPVTLHLAESRAEREMYATASGRLYDWLSAHRNMEDCGGVSPVAAAARAGILLPGVLAAHVNEAGPEDAATLAAAGVSVAHCPRSHAYFDHTAFPLQTLRRAGVCIALGTDSRASLVGEASEPALAMQQELQQLRRVHPGLDPEWIVHAATAAGAQALGGAGRFGELRAGTRADLVVTPYPGPLRNVFEALIHHQGRVLGTIARGQWVWRHPNFSRS